MQNRDGSISVIIPAYNAEQYIEQAIESVFDQTLQPNEIIVIDDGSTDRTPATLKKFGNRINYVKQENAGVSSARNRGIAESKSKFIAFLDSDDYFLLPEKLEKQVKIAQKKNCDIVISGWLVINKNHRPIAERKPWKIIPKLNLFNWLRFQGVLPSAMLFRRSALQKVDGFDMNLSHAEDIDLVLRMSLAGSQTEWLEEVSVAYRQHEGSLTRKVSEQSVGMNKLWKSFFSRSDLPFHVRRIENPVKFSSEVWIAFRAFSGGNYSLMKEHLLRSVAFSNLKKAGLLWEWVHRFIAFSLSETSEKLDVENFVKIKEWRELERNFLGI